MRTRGKTDSGLDIQILALISQAGGKRLILLKKKKKRKRKRPGNPCHVASQVSLVVKNLPANAGNPRDMGLIPGLGRSPGGGHGNPLQYFCLEKSMDRDTWWATVHGVTKESGHDLSD